MSTFITINNEVAAFPRARILRNRGGSVSLGSSSAAGVDATASWLEAYFEYDATYKTLKLIQPDLGESTINFANSQGDVVAYGLGTTIPSLWDGLPIATATVLGGIKVGAGLSITVGGVLSATGGAGTITGSGTANELTYWTGATSIGTLPVATYPSLTELSYVKGVTSAIQTQLNSKQATLTNPVTGTGTTNYVPKFTGASTIGNSLIFDNGSIVVIGGTSATRKFEVVVGSAVNEGIGLRHASGNTSEGVDIMYNSTGTTNTYFDSRYDSSAAAINFRLRTAGTPVTVMTLLGSGIVNVPSNGGSGGYTSTGNYGGTGSAAYFPNGLWSNGATAWIYGNIQTDNNFTRQGRFIIGSNAWGAGTMEVHNQSWNGTASDNYGGVSAGKIYAYGGLNSGGGTGNEAGTGQLYVQGITMLNTNTIIGSGTNTPNGRLDVRTDGAASVPNLGTASSNGLNLTRTDGAVGLSIGYVTDGNSYLQAQRFDSAVAYNLLLQPRGGNVGIGTTSPSSLLQLSKAFSLNNSMLRVKNDNAADFGHVAYDTLLIQQTDAPCLRLYESGEDKAFTISTDNNTSSIAYNGSVMRFFLGGVSSNAGYSGMGGTEIMRINNSNDLHVKGEVTAYSSTLSDRRLKENIVPLAYGINDLMKLKPVSYDLISNHEKHLGFIAQEVQEIMPEVTKLKNHFDEELLTLNYQEMIPLLVQSIQDLKAEIEELKSKIK